ncbi:hypothetical protein K435DRAFT_800792 [Dendrothele bispora CBS 962.96]|uniref:Uncharacterized protein n=1 Tax=Dendrothele bispora (strain CBS 962.96) TaxID=1314807 RepID=A0A4S8LSZ6_DENBC|nr:hypothetical protein K435DRAFT_800792 [Dendrothele bispora CBS 962.96]
MSSPFVFTVQSLLTLPPKCGFMPCLNPDHLKITQKSPSKAPEANLSILLPIPSTETTEEAIGDHALFCEEEEPGELDELMVEEVEPSLEWIIVATLLLIWMIAEKPKIENGYFHSYNCCTRLGSAPASHGVEPLWSRVESSHKHHGSLQLQFHDFEPGRLQKPIDGIPVMDPKPSHACQLRHILVVMHKVVLYGQK